MIILGTLEFYLSRLFNTSVPYESREFDEIEISLLGQILGWGCAVFGFGSRIPQIIKNLQRKSTEGLNVLFFLFACLGNITYALSIVSISLNPRYLLANLSLLVGSAGTLVFDVIVLLSYRITDESCLYNSLCMEKGMRATKEADWRLKRINTVMYL